MGLTSMTKSVFRAGALVLIAATLFAGSPSKAASINRTAVVATLSVPNGAYQGVNSVTLLADGRVQMVKNKTLVDTIIVSAKTRELLLNAARNLSDAELDDQTSAIICRAYFPRDLLDLSVSGFDTATDAFNSKMRTVLTSDECDTARIVRPIDDVYWKLAMELRAQLKIIFLQTLK